MVHPLVVAYSAFFLAHFSTPQTGQSCMPAESFGGMNSPQSHDLRWLSGMHHPERMDIFRRSFCHMVSGPEVLSSSSHLLVLMDFRIHEASGGGHLLESVGEILGPLMVEVGAVHLEMCSPSSLDEVRIFSEGLTMTLLEELHKGPPLFLPLAGMFFQSDV